MKSSESKIFLLLLVFIIGVFSYLVGNQILQKSYKELDLNLVEKEMIFLVNTYRQENGIKPLNYASWLEPGAQERATEMANYGNHRYVASDGTEKVHTRPTGESWATAFENIEGENGKERFLSENIVLIMTSRSKDEAYLAKSMFEQWKSSPPHNEAMLSPNNKSFAFKAAKMPGSIKNENVVKGRSTYIGVQIFDTYLSRRK